MKLKLDAAGMRAAEREIWLQLDHFALERQSCAAYQDWLYWSWSQRKGRAS